MLGFWLIAAWFCLELHDKVTKLVYPIQVGLSEFAEIIQPRLNDFCGVWSFASFALIILAVDMSTPSLRLKS